MIPEAEIFTALSADTRKKEQSSTGSIQRISRLASTSIACHLELTTFPEPYDWNLRQHIRTNLQSAIVATQKKFEFHEFSQGRIYPGDMEGIIFE